MAADLDQQTAGGQILVVKPVAAQHRPRQAGKAALHGFLPGGGKAQVQPPVGQADGAAVVAPGNDHHLGGACAVDGAHRLDQRAVGILDGIPVDVQHHFDRRILPQILLGRGAAAVVTLGVAGGIVQRFVVQRVDARRVQHLGHAGTHGAHVQRGVAGTGGSTAVV